MKKWDLVEKNEQTINEITKVLRDKLSFMDYFKPVFISALSGKRIEKIMPNVIEVYGNNTKRITTGVLNDVIQKAVLTQEPPTKKGRKLKILYATQAEISPPTFIIFVNDSSLVHFSYERFLENKLRASINFEGTPIKIIFKNRKEKDY